MGGPDLPILVARDGWIDRTRPAVDAAGERLYLLEALRAKPQGHVERSHSVMAEDDNRLIGVEFGVGTGWHVAHRHQKRVWNEGCLELPLFTDIEQERRIRLLELLSEGLRLDLGIEHPNRLVDEIRLTPARVCGMMSASCSTDANRSNA